MNRRCWVCVGVVVILGWLAEGAEAARRQAPQPSDQVDEMLTRYNLHPSLEKLGRGVTNVLTGWLEVPLNIHKRYGQPDTATSLFTGLIYGAAKGIVRTGLGVYEAVTFWLPYPEDFAPILPPLDYFKGSETRREPLLLE